LRNQSIISRRDAVPGRAPGGAAPFWSGLALSGFLACATGARAQGVLAPPSQPYERPAVSQSITTSPAGGVPPEAGLLAPSAGLWQWGSVDFHPHLLYRLLYGDGIPSGPGDHQTTMIQEISPGLLLDLGRQWTLDYTPALRLYSSRKFADGTDQSAVLAGQTSYQDWSYKLSQTYSSSSAPLLETEAPTEQVNYMTALSADRQLGSHLSAQLGANQNFRTVSEFGGAQDVREWSGSSGLNWQFWRGFGIGVTASGGCDLITPGSDMTFEQGQASVNYQPGDKLNLALSAGMEDTQINGARLANPTFSASVIYRPLDGTAASLSATRSVTPSFFQNTVTVDTIFSGTVSQKLFRKFSLDASGGYSTTPFIGFARISDGTFTLTGLPRLGVAAVSRQDDSTFFNVRLSCPFLKRGTASLFFQETDTTSSVSLFSLTSTQVGLELGYRY
jgi:hypothetical protein